MITVMGRVGCAKKMATVAGLKEAKYDVAEIDMTPEGDDCYPGSGVSWFEPVGIAKLSTVIMREDVRSAWSIVWEKITGAELLVIVGPEGTTGAWALGLAEALEIPVVVQMDPESAVAPAAVMTANLARHTADVIQVATEHAIDVDF